MHRTGSTKSRKVSTQSLQTEKMDEALSDEVGATEDLTQLAEEEEEYDYSKYLPWIKVSTARVVFIYCRTNKHFGGLVNFCLYCTHCSSPGLGVCFV